MYPIVSIEKTSVAVEYLFALDRLRVVAISTTSGPGFRIDRY